jgi:hypothetical protein
VAGTLEVISLSSSGEFKVVSNSWLADPEFSGAWANLLTPPCLTIGLQRFVLGCQRPIIFFHWVGDKGARAGAQARRALGPPLPYLMLFCQFILTELPLLHLTVNM